MLLQPLPDEAPFFHPKVCSGLELMSAHWVRHSSKAYRRKQRSIPLKEARKNFRDLPVQRRYSQVMSMDQTDEAIMVAVREGDLEKLEILYRKYREPLYEFFSRLTGNRVISEDLVHDVFVRILKYRSSYREANRFVTWMYQIGRNARTDYIKHHSAAPIQLYSFQETHDSMTPSRQFEESEERALLQCALMRISESNRELLLLARFQEMNYEDIATIYGVEIGTIKMRVYRATIELRQLYLNLRKDQSCNAMKSGTTLPTM
jgi:RNA polymerase sigma-70 factor (ECF subfamily)